ncbi:MAG: hypothetical protein GY722_08415 [bacterium]|nr:hypothetical protein [bacterium]
MTRKAALVVLLSALLLSGCGRLGTGIPACDTPSSNPNSATVLTLQAVPEAAFSPCVTSIPLGWDDVEFDVERGQMRLELGREYSSFLDVTLTPSCDIGEAIEVPTDIDGIARYEAITEVSNEIRIVMIPNAERPRVHATTMMEQLQGVRVDDRPLVFSIDDDIDASVRSRVNKALFANDYVWIVGDLDVDEGTLEMRATPDGEEMRGLEIDEALDLVGDLTPEVRYEGQWFFVFEGGCITYDFDAEGNVASSVAGDTEKAIGFYPNSALRDAAESAGYRLLDE